MMKSAKFDGNKISIIETQKPFLNTKGAIIKVLGCGLCGSDLIKIKHKDKNAVLGHEVVGVIEQINVFEDKFKIGDIVSLTHHYPCFNCDFCKNGSYSMCRTFKNSNIYPNGFSEYIKIDKNHLQYTVYKMNTALKEDEMAFLEPLSCTIRAVRRAGFSIEADNSKYSALVIGLGSIGLLMLKSLKAFNVQAFGFDISKQRMDEAHKHGFNYDKNRKYDTVFLCAGSTKAIQGALESVIDGGKIIVFSSVEDDNTGFFNNEIYYRELSIIASYSPSIEDIKLSSELLNSKKVDVASISTYYSLDNLACAIDDSLNNRVFKVYVKI